jgi:thermitase
MVGSVRSMTCALAGMLVLALLLAVAPAALAKQAPRDPSTILVKFTVSKAAAAKIIASLGDKLLGETATGVSVVKIGRGGKVDQKVKKYRRLPGVAYAEPNFIAKAQMAAPNDPSYSSQWGLKTVRAQEGWTTYPGTYASAGGATLAIVDTGIDAAHPDLKAHVLATASANCVSPSGSCTAGPAPDDNGHGTHVAGIAAAETNNGTGVAGTAYSSAIVPVKVLDSNAQGSYASITNGIMWAAQQGARAINLSLGGSAYSQTLCDAVSKATALGSLVVASAGNSSSSAPNYPAACPGAVGVAATDSGDSPASFSNFGSPNVFVSAPGVSIYSTYPHAGYTTMSGTSMAAPFVTGLAALLFGELPGRTITDVKTLLATTSDKVGSSGYGSDPYGTCASCTWNASYGYGRIDLARALAVSAPAADFGITASPPEATAPQGGAATYTVSVTPYNGFAGAVDLSVAGLPSGASATFVPSSVSAPGSSVLAVTLAQSVAPGSYRVDITGRSGSITHVFSVTLVVASSSDFTLTVAPGTVVVKAGLPTYLTVKVLPTGIFAGPVALSVTGLPPGVIAVFTPPIVPAPGLSALVLKTDLTTPAGTYTLTITGTSGSVTHSATASLVVK